MSEQVRSRPRDAARGHSQTDDTIPVACSVRFNRHNAANSKKLEQKVDLLLPVDRIPPRRAGDEDRDEHRQLNIYRRDACVSCLHWSAVGEQLVLKDGGCEPDGYVLQGRQNAHLPEMKGREGREGESRETGHCCGCSMAELSPDAEQREVEGYLWTE